MNSLPLSGSHKTHRRSLYCNKSSEGLHVLYMQKVDAERGINMFGVCACDCVGKWQQNYMSSWVSVPWLWLCVDLSPKLNLYSSPSPPSASLRCPLPGTFVFTWPTSQGTRSYLWLLGLAAECAAPVNFFSLRLTPAPKLNYSVISCHPPLTTSLRQYLPIKSNFNV